MESCLLTLQTFCPDPAHHLYCGVVLDLVQMECFNIERFLIVLINLSAYIICLFVFSFCLFIVLFSILVNAGSEAA